MHSTQLSRLDRSDTHYGIRVLILLKLIPKLVYSFKKIHFILYDIKSILCRHIEVRLFLFWILKFIFSRLTSIMYQLSFYRLLRVYCLTSTNCNFCAADKFSYSKLIADLLKQKIHSNFQKLMKTVVQFEGTSDRHRNEKHKLDINKLCIYLMSYSEALHLFIITYYTITHEELLYSISTKVTMS